MQSCAEKCKQQGNNCLAFDYNTNNDYNQGNNYKDFCRTTNTITGGFQPRNHGGIGERRVCYPRYTCQDFSGSCDANEFEMPDSTLCGDGSEACTKEQCCLNPDSIQVCTYVTESETETLTVLGSGSGGSRGSGGKGSIDLKDLKDSIDLGKSGGSGGKGSIDLGNLIKGGGSTDLKAQKSTFGEWVRTSAKQECRSECRAVSAGSY